MWNTLASKGFSSEDMTARAVETVLTNTIVPYLDTSSVYFQQLVDQQPNLVKQIRGIGAATMEISGSSIAANKFLQDMVNDLSPVGELADQELGKQYAKSLGIYEDLIAQGAKEWEIGEYYSGVARIAKDPLKALNSGELDLQLGTVTAIANGGNMSDIGYLTESYMPGVDMISNMTPEGNHNMLYAGITNTHLSTAAKASWNANNYDVNRAIAAGNKTSSVVDVLGEKKAKEFADDLNQTNTELQEITMENISNEFATMKGFMGHWYGVLETAIKGIGGLITAYLGGKFLSSLAGGKLGTAITSGLGKGGTVASGLSGVAGVLTSGAAIVGGTAAVMSILTGIYNGVRDNTFNSNMEITKSELQDTAFANDSAYAYAKNMGITDSEEERGFWGNVGAFFGNAGQGTWLGLNKVFNGGDFVGNNKKYFDTIRTRGDFGKDDADNLMYAYAFLLNEIHSLKSLEEYGFTEQSLKDYLKNESPEEIAYTKRLVNTMIEEGTYVPSGRNGEKPTSVNWNNYHRLGLDSVPYDNYPAILHEDEAVLTASTAAELRNLITEYRDTQTQNANFEAIIQNQTVSLVTKLDEVIKAIQFSNSVSSKVSAMDSVFDNMKYIRSTKSFN